MEGTLIEVAGHVEGEKLFYPLSVILITGDDLDSIVFVQQILSERKVNFHVLGCGEVLNISDKKSDKKIPNSLEIIGAIVGQEKVDVPTKFTELLMDYPREKEEIINQWLEIQELWRNEMPNN